MENPDDQENNYFAKKEKKEEEKKKNETVRKAKKFIKSIPWILIPVAIIGGFVWYVAKTTPENSNLGGGLNTCVQHDGSVGMHIHPQVTIAIDGQNQKIPADIGVSSVCMRPIHTHDGTGILHLEFSKPRDVRLGEFFQVWEKEFNSTRIFDHYNVGDKKVRMHVNGVENFDFENYIMRDKDKIEIKYAQ